MYRRRLEGKLDEFDNCAEVETGEVMDESLSRADVSSASVWEMLSRRDAILDSS